MRETVLSIMITDRDYEEEFAAWHQEKGIPLVLTVLGEGTATTEILDYLGLEASEKAVLLCIMPRSPRLVRQAEKELWLDLPGRGILLTVPLSSICENAAKGYLMRHKEEATMETKEATYELLIVITNQGHTDLVMEAARSAGATGGTTIHAKGIGMDEAQKFFGISIAAERELVFILVRSEKRRAIMKAIMCQAGVQSEAQSVVFSLPVCDVAGLRHLDDEDAE